MKSLRYNPRVAARNLRRGFSLVELLTVIAIIGVLTAITIPAIHKVRVMAHQTQCASTLRQIGSAVQMYANDNGGMLPGPLNAYQTGYYKDKSSAELVAHIQPYFAEQEWIGGGTLRAKNFICPAWTAMNDTQKGACYQMNMNFYTDDKNYFEPFGRAASSRPPHNVTELDGKTSSMYILYEVDNLNALGVVSFAPVHGKVRHRLFFDTHVEAEDAIVEAKL